MKERAKEAKRNKKFSQKDPFSLSLQFIISFRFDILNEKGFLIPITKNVIFIKLFVIKKGIICNTTTKTDRLDIHTKCMTVEVYKR